jgi:hypothetical protein
MICGHVELLTPRCARGWAYGYDRASTPLTVRVRHGLSVLAQVDLMPRSSGAPVSFFENRAHHGFELNFPTPVEFRFLPELSVEAASLGASDWFVLPRQLKVGTPVPDPQLPAFFELTHSSGRPAPEPALPTAYWSDETAREDTEVIQDRPVFVVGAVRSGTTVVTYALERCTRYRGFSEGHVFDIVIRLAHAMNSHFEWKERWLSRSEVALYHLGHISHAFVRDELVSLIRRLACGYTTPFWFDKTPTFEMVATVPLLAEAWPNARFIFMKRRGLENLRSRLRKFSKINFSGVCRDWNQVMSAWRVVRDVVPGRFVELDQRTLGDDPDGAAAALGPLLDLAPSEVESMATVFRQERPESTGMSADVVADISELGWTPEQIENFRQTCGAEMTAYGYSYDANYWSDGQEHQ